MGDILSDSAVSEPVKNPIDRDMARDLRSPGTWRFFWCYLLIGSASLLVLLEVVESGLWVKLGSPCIMIWFGIMGLVDAHRKERKHLGKHSQ